MVTHTGKGQQIEAEDPGGADSGSDDDESVYKSIERMLSVPEAEYARSKAQREVLIAKIAARREAEAKGKGPTATSKKRGRSDSTDLYAVPPKRDSSLGLFGGAAAVEEAALRQKLAFSLGESPLPR